MASDFRTTLSTGGLATVGFCPVSKQTPFRGKDPSKEKGELHGLTTRPNFYSLYVKKPLIYIKSLCKCVKLSMK
jgi:hypothetical protein